jgi:hypothetical protein
MSSMSFPADEERMTTGKFPEPVIRSKPMSRGSKVLLQTAVFLVGMAVLVLVNGKPSSNWLYVIFALAIGLNAYHGMKLGNKPPIPTDPPMEVRAAAAEGIFAGASLAIVYFTFMVALTGEWYQWITAIAIGVFLGIDRYRSVRGKRTPMKAVLIGLAVFFVVGSVLVVLMVNAKH